MNRRRTAEALAIALLLAIAAVVLRASWQRWLDPIIDSGRDLYIPEALRGGAVLYRDLRYVYPPLAPYLLALLTMMTGSSLAAYAAIGIGIAAATAALLYGMARRVAGAAAAFAATLLFVACSLAGASTFGCNYVFPYSHAATIGMLLALAACACALPRQGHLDGTLEPGSQAADAGVRVAVRVRRDDGRVSFGRATLLVFFATAAASTKIEMLFVATAIVGAAWLARRVSGRVVAAYVLSLAATALMARFVFGPALWPSVFPQALLGGGSARAFYSRVSGMASARANLAASAAGALRAGAFVALLAVLTRTRRTERSRRLEGTPGADGMRGTERMRGAARTALIGGGLAFVAYGLAGDHFFRAWTLLQLALVPYAWKRRAEEPLLILLAMSLASTSRIFLALTPDWYGFVHAVPLYLLVAYVLFALLPRRGVYSPRIALLWLVPIAAIAVQEVRYELEAYALRSFPVLTVRGTFFDANLDRAAILNEALPLLAGRSLAVMPEGIALDYFAHAKTPLSFYVFTPPEIGDEAIERVIVAELQRRRPESVAIVTRDLHEFGSRGFGVDYARPIVAALRERYVVERQWRAERFTLILLRLRRQDAPR